MAEALRKEANAHFVAKRYEEALALYNKALELDSTDHLCLSNKAAALYQLGQHEAALEASRAAAVASPTFGKARVREAQCLLSLGRYLEALGALQVARTLEPTNAQIVRMQEEAAREQRKVDRAGPIRDAAQFEGIFARTTDSRLSLCTLATFWNECTGVERYEVFKEFLKLVAGPSSVVPRAASTAPQGVHIEDFSADQFTPLPMDNYADVEVPSAWVKWFQSLPSATEAEAAASSSESVPPRVLLLRALWNACSADEQRLIVGDFRTFFAPRVEDAFAGHPALDSSAAAAASSSRSAARSLSSGASTSASASSSVSVTRLAHPTAQLLPPGYVAASATSSSSSTSNISSTSSGATANGGAGGAGGSGVGAGSSSGGGSGSAAKIKITRRPDGVTPPPTSVNGSASGLG